MSYNAQETGQQSGYPLELYEWTDGVETIRNTSGDEILVDTSPPATWETLQLRRNEPEKTAALDAATLEVTAPRDFVLALRFRVTVPGRAWFLTIYRLHRNDGPTPERRVFWKGLLRSVSWSGAWATMHLQSINGLLKSEGLRLQYQRGCNHMHYAPGCNLSATAHQFTGPIVAVSGLTVSVSIPPTPNSPPVSGLAAPQALLGTAVAENGERRMITAHAFTPPSGPHVLTVLQPFAEAAVGQVLTVRRGCARTQAACGFFGNLANFGGIPTIPINNPFVHGIEA